MPEKAIDIFSLLEEAKEDEDYYGSPVRPLEIKSGQGVVFASIERLTEIVEGDSYLCFVWPDEGSFDEKGYFQFNEGYGEFEPIIVDRTTANAMKVVYKAIIPAKQEIFAQRVAKNRANFCKMVDLTWASIK